MAQYNSNIATQENNLAQSVNDLADTNNMLNEVDEQIASLTETMANLENQLNVLNGREEELRTVQGDDEVSFKRRGEQNSRVLEALNRILDMLTEAVLNENEGVSLIEKR
jgi:septal ring factor EnvC (AmiA/AmiB activator)